MNKKVDISKTVVTLISLNIIQIGALIMIILYSLSTSHGPSLWDKPDSEFFLILIVVVTTLLNSFISIRDRFVIIKSEAQAHIIEETLIKVENLNKVLRAQRHDFLNHLQVVYGLIGMDEFEASKDYIEKVYNDIQKVSKILKTSNAAVNALLQAKTLNCEKRGIMVNLNVTSQYKDLKIPSWEMCRVLGNLIDNAMDALSEISGEKLLGIELFEDLKNYCFRISDNGPMIPDNIINRIFEAGFTTKGENGEGMGLAITSDIITKYGGNIEVASNNKTTVFQGYIPK